MSANLENSAVNTGMENVSFHPDSKEGLFQRIFKLLHNCTHFTRCHDLSFFNVVF